MRMHKNLFVLVGLSVFFILFNIPAFAQSRDTHDVGADMPFANHDDMAEVDDDDEYLNQDQCDIKELGLFKAMKGGRKREILKAVASQLCDLQADIIGDNANNEYVDDDPDDGGWDWRITPTTTSHSPDPSAQNTYGVTALGLTSAYLGGVRKPRFFMGMLDAYLGMEGRSEVDSAPDFVYLVFLDHLFKNQGFLELARERYEDRVSGDALAFAKSIRDSRGDNGDDGLIPFDLGWFVWAAAALEFAFPGVGYFDDAQIYGRVIADDIKAADDINDPEGYFNIHDPKERYYIIGIACAMHALKLSRVDLSLVPILKQKLFDLQLPDGSWYWSADYQHGNYQSTAYAVQKLSFVCDGDFRARLVARAGSNWLASRQLPTGGWEYSPGLENTEVDAEILYALYRVPPVIKFKKRKKEKDGMERSSNPGSNIPPIATPLAFEE